MGRSDPRIGGQLRQARERLGLSVEQVYQKTRIRPEILRAIEEDRCEGIRDIYLKGFVKQYAECVGLRARELISQGLPASSSRPVRASALTPRVARGHVSSTSPSVVGVLVERMWAWRRPLVTGLVALAAVGLAVGVARATRKPTVTRSAPTPPVKAVASAPSATVSVPATKATIQPVAGPFRVELKTIQACWVTVRIDGAVLFQGVLPKGAKESWQAQAQASFDLNPAEGVELAVNGRSLGSPGRGFVKNFLLKP